MIPVQDKKRLEAAEKKAQLTLSPLLERLVLRSWVLVHLSVVVDVKLTLLMRSS